MRGDTTKKIRLTSDEYYPWKNKWSTEHLDYPWEREHLNEEFLKHEQKRIEDLQNWFKRFRKADVTEKMEEASFYTIPVKLSSYWKKDIPRSWKIMGLSALYNSPVVPIIAIFPHDNPSEYRPIRVTKSKPLKITNEYHMKQAKVLVVYEWDREKSEKIYVDVPFEKKIISKLIEENFVSDRLVSESFQCPILSAPPVVGDIGGISLSSFTEESKFALEVIKTVEMMTPPEMRSSKPPKKEFEGHNFSYKEGVQFQLAERPPSSTDRFTGIFSPFSKIKNQYQRRKNYDGEYSIFSTIRPEKGYGTSSVVKNLMKNFRDSEATLPYDLHEFRDRHEELESLRKVVNGELWVQVVYSHQFNPILEDKEKELTYKFLKRLKKDYDALLIENISNDRDRERMIKNHLLDKGNLKRTAQSFARADERNKLKKKDFQRARGLIIDQFDEFRNNEEVKNFFLFADSTTRDEKNDILQSYFIENEEAKIEDIWESVKDYKVFRDKEDLKQVLDEMRKDGDIIESHRNVYKWV